MAKLTLAANADEIGFDSKQLQYAYKLLDEWTSTGDPPMPAATLLVGRGDAYVPAQSFGRQGPEKDAPKVHSNGIYLMASITKPVVYMAALQLVEQGRLRLSDRVVDLIPEFAANHKNDVRVIDLMRHTSGLPDMLPDNTELRAAHAPLSRFIRGAIDVAPLFPPRTDFSYQSMGTLVVAELVQRISGQTIRDYLREHILDPLGMQDSALGRQGLDRDRIVRVEVSQASDWDWNSDYWQEFGAPWGAMFSTAEDFAILCHSLLGKDDAPVSILAPTTIDRMISNQLEIGELPESVRLDNRWGLGWKLNVPTAPDPLCELLGPETFGHTGATGTLVWMDPSDRSFMVLLTTGIRSKAPWRLRAISNIVAAAKSPQTW